MSRRRFRDPEPDEARESSRASLFFGGSKFAESEFFRAVNRLVLHGKNKVSS